MRCPNCKYDNCTNPNISPIGDMAICLHHFALFVEAHQSLDWQLANQVHTERVDMMLNKFGIPTRG